MQPWTVEPMPRKKTDRHISEGNWPRNQNEPAVAGASVSDSVATYAGVSRSASSAAPVRALSDAAAHLLPHFRAITGFLNRYGRPEDELIAQFLESMISTSPANMRVDMAELEARFFQFLDVTKHNNLHAIHLSSGVETKVITHMTLHDLSKILKVNPGIYSSDTGQ
ncbi:MAG: hypothetical protein V7651_02345 [Hyphomonas oceanitis]|uniref:hypothetical protein n=1 Tax=Hyphomonas oceanitis TaxID=81033 RepID=UPI003002A998